MSMVRTAEQRGSRPRRARRPRARSLRPPEDVPPEPTSISPALQASVLVLNRLYMAVHIVRARRAFVLLFRDAAEVIHQENGTFGNHDFESWRNYSELRAGDKQPHEDWIRAVNFELQVPRVIRLLSYDRMPRQKLQLNRRSVLARDEHRCQYCGRQFPPQRLSLDHVIPRSRGGRTTWENVVCACLECNIKKGGRTPREAKMKLVRRPIRPKRNPMLVHKLASPKYQTWMTWLDGAHWEIVASD